ncbi:MAG: transporter [Bacteroidetes bacterium MedPE-SWsnd-G2]|nr:MAG: transporter [Bacteroidetes bacterium MedPE-SWsnd-G2]
MNYIKSMIYIGCVLLSYQVVAQRVLTKSEALEIALENNYGVKIANNNVEIAKNNSSIYNSGYLPSLSANAGANYNLSDQTVEFQDGSVTDVEGAESKGYNASVNMNYVLFDGMGRKYNYKQLKETYNLSELQARETIENMHLQLFSVYFQIARLSENVTNLDKALNISKERLKRAEYQYEYGQTTKLELLNAEVDVNNDSIALLNANQLYDNSKRDLNILLGVKEAIDFEVETEVEFLPLFTFEDVLEKAKQNNVSLLQADKNIAISEFNLKVNKSGYIPTIGLNGSYGWNKNINPSTAFNAGTDVTGLNAGITFTWDIFDGGSTKTRIANSQIQLENQKILKQQQEETLDYTMKNSFESYRNALFVLQAQEQNILTNKNNFDRSVERYKLGQISSIEFRQAQVNLLNAQTAYNDAKFTAKLLELELLQLTGEITNVAI